MNETLTQFRLRGLRIGSTMGEAAHIFTPLFTTSVHAVGREEEREERQDEDREEQREENREEGRE